MLKKFFVLFLILVFCMAPSILAAETFEYQGITYSVEVIYDEEGESAEREITVTAISSNGSAGAVVADFFAAADILKYLGYDDPQKEITILSDALEEAGELEITVKKSDSFGAESSDSSDDQSEGFINEDGLYLEEDPDEVVPESPASGETAPAEDVITVILHEIFTMETTTVEFADQQPVIIEGRTLVPARGVFEQMGYMVDWDAETSTAMVSNDDVFIKIPIGQNYLLVNDEAVEIDVPAQIISSRTMLPLRAISEALDMQVEWDAATRTVSITY